MEISKPKPHMPVKSRALYDVVAVGDALCVEVLEVVLKVLEAALKVLKVELKMLKVALKVIEVALRVLDAEYAGY